MEPLTIVTISAAVGGTAGKLAEKAWDLGERWLSNYFQDHFPNTIKKAKENSLEFLANLAQRVHHLESVAKHSENIKKTIMSALDDPDFSATLKDALLASSRTSNNNIHKVMARIVAERLRCQSDDIVALIIPLACDSLRVLTSKQIQFLATATILERLFPEQAGLFTLVQPERAAQFSLGWLKEKLPLLLPQEPVTNMDLIHMESISCIHLTRLKVHPSSLAELLIEKTQVESEEIKEFRDFLSATDLGHRLQSCWNGVISNIALTSVGELIGITAYDELTGEQTDVKLYIN